MNEVKDFVVFVSMLVNFFTDNCLRKWLTPEQVGVPRQYPSADSLTIVLVPEESRVRLVVKRFNGRAGKSGDELVGIYRIEYPALQFLVLAAKEVAAVLGYEMMSRWEVDKWDITFYVQESDAWTWDGEKAVRVEYDLSSRTYHYPVEVDDSPDGRVD